MNIELHFKVQDLNARYVHAIDDDRLEDWPEFFTEKGRYRITTAENVALQCAKVDLEYKPQKADGSLDAGVHFKYDIKGNKEG